MQELARASGRPEAEFLMTVLGGNAGARVPALAPALAPRHVNI